MSARLIGEALELRGIEPLVQALLILRKGEILAGEEGVRAEDHRHAGLDAELAGQLPAADHRVQHLRHRSCRAPACGRSGSPRWARSRGGTDGPRRPVCARRGGPAISGPVHEVSSNSLDQVNELITAKPLLKRCSTLASMASYWFWPHGIEVLGHAAQNLDRVEQLVHRRPWCWWRGNRSRWAGPGRDSAPACSTAGCRAGGRWHRTRSARRGTAATDRSGGRFWFRPWVML